jgi:YfiR/HmsC-like
MALLKLSRSCERPRGMQAVAGTWCVVWGLLLAGMGASAQTGPSTEYQIKAVFLFNFAQFVEWPPAAFDGAGSPLVIGVLGADPFGGYLEDTVRGEKVASRPLEVQRYLEVDEIKTCHVLFISRSEASRLEQILVTLKNRSILIVGDGDDFVQRGGMIRLATTQNRIRLIVNVEAARAATLTISSKLLRSAEVVTASKK